jgi:RHS repeat-associated protein
LNIKDLSKKMNKYVHSNTLAQNKLAYDYHLTDHVGNIRTVLTEEAVAPTDFKATMETANRTQEEGWFEGIGHTEHNKPTGFDANGSNAKVSRLFNASGNDKRVGPAIVLKVMSGDKFTAQVRGWYLPNGTDDALLPDAVPVLQQVVDAFGAALPTGSKIGAAQAGLAGGAINSFLTLHQPAPPTDRPKAYLNWMLLDEQGLALDASVRGARLVPAITGTMPAQLIQANGGSEIPITRNGYLFVFVSNESQGNVYFDDLSVVYTPGPLLEEHHFYPSGLEMLALSSAAGNGHVRNKYGYQGQENEWHFALNLNEFEARHYDPQSTRWMVPDPANQFASPYVGMGNAWVNGVDPDGRFVFIAAALLLAKVPMGIGVKLAVGAMASMVANKDRITAATEGENGNAWKGLGTALGYAAVGAAGTAVGLNSTGFTGFMMGGSLNVIYEGAIGQFEKEGINVGGRMLGSFITGGTSALAGKNFGAGFKSGELLADAKLNTYDALGQLQYNPLELSKLGKFGLSGLENLGSKLNEKDGKLEIGEMGGYFASGVAGAFISYSMNFAGMKVIPNRNTFKDYGAAAIISPFIANTTADIGLNYFNHLSYGDKKAPESFGSFYTNYFKSIFKVDFYTGSSMWGYFNLLKRFNYLSNPSNILN